MRILIVQDYPQEGGAEIYIQRLKQLLEKRGFTIDIFYGKKTIWMYFSRWFSLKYFLKLGEKIKSFSPDLIHLNTFSNNLSPSILLAFKKYKIPVVTTVHDFHYICPRTWMIYIDKTICDYGFGKECLLSRCYPTRNLGYNLLGWIKVAIDRFFIKKFVDLFICPSTILANHMKKYLEVNNVVHIPNFADIGSQKFERKKETDEIYLLFVGRLSKEKGVKYLIKAMSLVVDKFPDVKLKIVGRGSEKQYLDNLSKKLDLGKNVAFFGYVPEEELQQLYHNCYAVIMPSIWMENNPIVGIEALAYGKPLLGSNIGGIPELINNGETGYIFEPKNYKELSKKIIDLISNSKKAKIFGQNARRLYQDFFTAEKYYEKIGNIYMNLIK